MWPPHPSSDISLPFRSVPFRSVPLQLCAVYFTHKNLVYLTPKELAYEVVGDLPGSSLTFEALVEEKRRLEEQLRPLDEERENAFRGAQRRANVYMGILGLGMVANFGVFLWLIFYELSWDVMEPVSYFVSRKSYTP